MGGDAFRLRAPLRVARDLGGAQRRRGHAQDDGLYEPATLMDTKITRAVALVALLIYASGTGSALCDLCPAPLLDGTLTIPDTATLQLKASTHGGDATLPVPHGAISGRASVTCQSGEFNATLYAMSDGSIYRCRGTIDGQGIYRTLREWKRDQRDFRAVQSAA
jgi:hypothetical protein